VKRLAAVVLCERDPQDRHAASTPYTTCASAKMIGETRFIDLHHALH
jgi:hypothetical protein